MSIIGAILLGGLATAAAVQARLGETVQEIENRVGKLKEANFKYTGIRLFRAHNKSGFTQIDYMFFKADDPQTAKCIGVMYLKVFSEGDQKITFEEAKKTIQENLPTFPVGFKVGPLKNVSDRGWGLSTNGDLWEVYWAIPNGGASASAVNLESPRAILISCLSYRYVWFDSAENGISLRNFTDSEKAEAGILPTK
jgi:hypothetical protein